MKRFVCILAIGTALGGCTSGQPAALCGSTPGTGTRLTRIASMNWAELSIDDAVASWQGEFASSNRTSELAPPCAGTTTLLSSERVEYNDCLCCETLLFGHTVVRESCVERLHAISVHRLAASFEEALELGHTLTWAITNARAKFNNVGVGVYRADSDTLIQGRFSQSVSVTLQRRTAGWVVFVQFSRIDLSTVSTQR